jgi:hypothetical protein
MTEGHASGPANLVSHKPESAREVLADAVRAELDRVLHSHEFRASKRSQEFLRYVVEHTLDGHADTLKERTIGADVFGRSASYDPSDDATVRVKAGEVRKRLGLYYSSDGQHDEVRIELPPGTYVPEFFRIDAQPAAPAAAEGAPAPAAAELTKATPAFRNWPWIAAAGALVLLGAASFAWLRLRPATTVVDEFWAPVLRGSSPVTLSAAFVPVYGVDPTMYPEKPSRIEDFALLTDQFVGGGDLIAVADLATMLGRMGRPYRVKIGSDVTFQDLRAAPTVLVGYSYTRWREISKELRFFIDAERRPRMVTDNGKPTEWSLPNLPADRRTNEDYAIVTRVFHPDTQAMLVEIAGITQYGTEAAADLVTNPDLLAEALQKAPAGWRHKNLQFVLHTKVIGGTAASPKTVATYYW